MYWVGWEHVAGISDPHWTDREGFPEEGTSILKIEG